jgi:hypothetical protein
LTLSDHDRHSALWKKLSEHLADQIRVLRAKNDGDLDLVETARLRGRISALKEIIALGDPPSPVMVADEL